MSKIKISLDGVEINADDLAAFVVGNHFKKFLDEYADWDITEATAKRVIEELKAISPNEYKYVLTFLVRECFLQKIVRAEAGIWAGDYKAEAKAIAFDLANTTGLASVRATAIFNPEDCFEETDILEAQFDIYEGE